MAYQEAFYERWVQAEGLPIVKRWCEWCDYLVKYGSHFDASFTIPVPQFFFEHYTKNTDPDGLKVDAFFREHWFSGNPVKLPPPVPAPPSQSFAGRAMQHGQASQSTGEAMWRGAKEGFKSQAPNAARTLLGLLFKR